jgi:hypothetical protein
MKSKGKDFDMSEPEFLIDVMNRHENYCNIICLVGGGQEINTGEAGLSEWVKASTLSEIANFFYNIPPPTPNL